MKNYNKERTLVGVALVIPCLLNPCVVEFIAALAIWFTFQHHQVASRMQETQNSKKPSVPCNEKLNLYFYAKELLWVVFYVKAKAYSGLIGSLIFLLYPKWRLIHNKKKPNDPTRQSRVAEIEAANRRNKGFDDSL